MNFTSFLEVNASYYGEKIAIIDSKNNYCIDYKSLLNKVNSLSYNLKKIGIEKGDRIIIATGSKPETIISYFAIWRIGAIAIPINPDYKILEISNIIDISKPKAIITSEDLLNNFNDIIKNDIIKIPLDIKNLNEKIDFSPENVSIDEICQIQFTSGTTGKPKGAILTHGNWMAAVEAEKWALELNENDIYLGFYPHFHVGVSWGITAIRYGATFIIMERYNLKDFLKLIKEYKATIISGMPPVLYELAYSPLNIEDYLNSVRCIITGGATTPEKIWRDFSKRFPNIKVVNAYGLSETLVLGSGTAVPYRYQYLSKNFKSVGLPIGYTEIKIVDPNNPKIKLPIGEIGEIAIRGPGVAKGYWMNSEETKKSFLEDGWFLTGDLGYIDEDGVLYITTRKKDVIIMSGWKIYPNEVEEVILKHPKVAEVAVFSKYDERRGEVPAAAIVLKSGENATSEEIIEFCKDKIANYKIPKYIIFLNELPKMNAWKILRRVLREKYGGFPNK
ncbi:MAG: class I adenylate-forming enzyme family protein [Candidatus Methanomethylicaceae archaeon]